MLASARCFGLSLQLPPSPKMLTADIVVTGPPTTSIEITWDKEMDQLSLPPLSVFELVLDGVPAAATARSWVGPNILQVDYAGAPPSTTGFLKLIVTDPALRAIDMTVAKAPQTVQFFP